jgi:hypothetical protein
MVPASLFRVYRNLVSKPAPQSPSTRPDGLAPQGPQNTAQGFNQVSTLGTPKIVVRPHKALPSSALLEKHPAAGLEVLKGRQQAR